MQKKNKNILFWNGGTSYLQVPQPVLQWMFHCDLSTNIPEVLFCHLHSLDGGHILFCVFYKKTTTLWWSNQNDLGRCCLLLFIAIFHLKTTAYRRAVWLFLFMLSWVSLFPLKLNSGISFHFNDIAISANWNSWQCLWRDMLLAPLASCETLFSRVKDKLPEFSAVWKGSG